MMDVNENAIPAFQVSRGPGGFRISVPVKTDRFRTLLNLVWLLVWAVGEVAIILFLLGIASPPESAPSIPFPLAGMLLAVLTVAGGVVLWRWLWCVGGRESFQVGADALWARREIWGIGHSRRFAYEKVMSVSAERLQYRIFYPSWGRMFIGHGGAEIMIEYAGRTYAYGKGLKEAEARDLVGLLEAEMSLSSPGHGFPRGPAYLV